jgi:hypothetical protein
MELQELLDEWILAAWQHRLHDGPRDPVSPGRAYTPNERYAALVESAGYVPVALSAQDYIELLTQAHHDYRQGVRPAGPGAREMIEFFDTVDGRHTRDAVPPKLTSDPAVRNLIARRAATLHLQPANYCWFADPARALCLKLPAHLQPSWRGCSRSSRASIPPLAAHLGTM